MVGAAGIEPATTYDVKTVVFRLSGAVLRGFPRLLAAAEQINVSRCRSVRVVFGARFARVPLVFVRGNVAKCCEW